MHGPHIPVTLELSVMYQKQTKLGSTILPRKSAFLQVHHNILIVGTITILRKHFTYIILLPAHIMRLLTND